MLDAYEAQRAQILADLQDAWGIAPEDVVFGQNVVPWRRVPNATATLQPVARALVGGRSGEDRWRWAVRGRFPMPAPGTDLLSLKIAKLRAFGRKVAPTVAEGALSGYACPPYAGALYLPQVTLLDPTVEAFEGGEMPDDSYFYVTVHFEGLADFFQ